MDGHHEYHVGVGWAGTEWADLAAGEVGTGLILYYLPSRGVTRPGLAVRLSKGAQEEVALAEVFDAPPGFDYVLVNIEGGVEQPSLVVRLSKAGAAENEEEVAVAEVFDAPPGLDYVPVDIEGERVSLASGAVPIMRIEALDGWWVREDATYDPIRGLLPPQDAATWQALNQQLAPFTITKRDPLDFKSWLSPFEGASMVIQNAKLSQMRAVENGFRFVLQLEPGFTISQSDLFDSTQFAAGTYLIQYDGQWQVELLTLPELSMRVELLTAEGQLSILDEALLQVVLRNEGLTDVKNVQLVGIMRQEGESWPITRQKIELLAGSTLSIPLNLHPKSVGAWTLEFWLEDEDKNVLVETSQQINVPTDKESGGWTIFSLSTGVGKQSLSLLLLLAFAASMIYALLMSAERE